LLNDVFDFFFLLLLVVKFLVTSTLDASLAHLGIVMDVGVGEAFVLGHVNQPHKERYRHGHNNQNQK